MNNENLKKAVEKYNSKHRKYKIEYADVTTNHVIMIYDNNDKFKVYIGFEYNMTVDEIVEILEDLRSDIK